MFCHIITYLHSPKALCYSWYLIFFSTKTDKELCQLTRQFEDFVVQFLDRCFALVENCSLEQVTGLDRTVSNSHKNTHETLMGTSVSGAIQGTLTQCSPQIFQVRNNMSGNVLCWWLNCFNVDCSGQAVQVCQFSCVWEWSCWTTVCWYVYCSWKGMLLAL